MIGYLHGKIISKKPTRVMLEVGGIGYIVNISISTFEKLADQKEASLFTYMSVRESAIDLYGFYSAEEKEMFELLISVSGIGPKSAQGILSGIQIPDLAEAIRGGNMSRLVSIPGIGRKTAERMVIELRDKVDSEGAPSSGATGVRSDAIAALVNLGYNQKSAERAVRAVSDRTPSISIEDLIKESLSLLNG